MIISKEFCDGVRRAQQRMLLEFMGTHPLPPMTPLPPLTRRERLRRWRWRMQECIWGRPVSAVGRWLMTIAGHAWEIDDGSGW